MNQKSVSVAQLWVAVASLLLTMLLGFVTAYGSAKAEAASIRERLEHHSKLLESHEPRIRTVEEAVPEIKADIRAIRYLLEKGDKR